MSCVRERAAEQGLRKSRCRVDGYYIGVTKQGWVRGGVEGNFLRNGTLEEVEDLNVKFGS